MFTLLNNNDNKTNAEVEDNITLPKGILQTLTSCFTSSSSTDKQQDSSIKYITLSGDTTQD